MSKFSENREEVAAASATQGPRWMWIGVVLVVLAGAWGAYYFFYYQKPASTLDSFAQCLKAKGAKMYGAWWCPHCAEQKELFGSSARRLPYVECSSAGQGSRQTAVCNEVGIKNYPTWIINGQRYTGIQTLDALAQNSKYKGEGGKP